MTGKLTLQDHPDDSAPQRGRIEFKDAQSRQRIDFTFDNSSHSYTVPLWFQYDGGADPHLKDKKISVCYPGCEEKTVNIPASSISKDTELACLKTEVIIVIGANESSEQLIKIDKTKPSKYYWEKAKKAVLDLWTQHEDMRVWILNGKRIVPLQNAEALQEFAVDVEGTNFHAEKIKELLSQFSSNNSNNICGQPFMQQKIVYLAKNPGELAEFSEHVSLHIISPDPPPNTGFRYNWDQSDSIEDIKQSLVGIMHLEAAAN